MKLEKGTVLCVEDNSDNRILIRRVLNAEGYSVVEAGNAVQALAQLEAGGVDIILLDINMPGIDGYALTSRIRDMRQYSRVPIVAVTANAMRGDRERSIEAGCAGYIQKPIDIDTLAYQLNRLMARSMSG